MRCYRIICIAILFSCCGILKINAQIGMEVVHSDFWKDKKMLGIVDYPGYPDSIFKDKSIYKYYLYKNSHNECILVGNGNGQLWRLNKDFKWERLDNTVYFGNNFGSYFFSDILKYGGYGFWKSNGQLLTFNSASKTWDIVKISSEKPSLNFNCFYDKSSNFLYQLGSYELNSGVNNEFVESDSIYVLDLMKQRWVNLGKINKKISSFLAQKNLNTSLEFKEGILLFLKEEEQIVVVNLINTQCSILKGKIRNELFKFLNEKEKGQLLISTPLNVYLVDSKSLFCLDSLSWKDILNSNSDKYELLESDYSNHLTLISLIFGLAGLFIFIAIHFNRKKSNIEKVLKESFIERNLDFKGESGELQFFEIRIIDNLISLNNVNINDRMSESALLMLKELINKSISGEVLTTIQINELLDIDRRSIDNQKKIRSEVVKAINQIFNEIGFSQTAVQRVRQDDDRRMVVYYLNSDLKIKVN